MKVCDASTFYTEPHISAAAVVRIIILLPTGDDGVRELSQMWGKDKSISEINLSAHNIGPGAAEALANALRASLSITSVDCSLNSALGNEGVRLLVPALRTDGMGISTVRVLSLMRCGIGDAGENIRCALQLQAHQIARHSYSSSVRTDYR